MAGKIKRDSQEKWQKHKLKKTLQKQSIDDRAETIILLRLKTVLFQMSAESYDLGFLLLLQIF